MVTSVLQDRQYMFGVKLKFALMVENVLLMSNDLVSCCFDS